MSEMLETLVVVATHRPAYGKAWKERGALLVGPGPEADLQTPFDGFDTGAYLWAYWHRPAKKYLFLQETLIPTIPDYANVFFCLLETCPVVAWMGFPFPLWDSPSQQLSAQYAIGPHLPEKGIFGPIFAATHEALETIHRNRLVPPIPNHKEAAQGKEREWAMAFNASGIPVHFLHPSFDPRTAIRDGLYPFRKEFGSDV